MLLVTVHGLRREMGLGAYPGVSLKEAREEAEKWRAVVRRNLDPIKERERERRQAERNLNLLKDIALDAFETRKAELKGEADMSKTQKDKGNDQQTKGSELTEAETNVVADLRERKRSRVRAPDIKLDFDEDTRRLTVGHKGKDPMAACALAMHELGTADYRFFEGVMDQVATLGQQDSSISETASNFVMSVVAGVGPQDEIEAMLAIQMGAIHQATMTMARRLNHVKSLPQQDSAERALNKLARTFTSQVETLKRYRSKADQTVRVERVEVKEGGQAIVGNVQNGGRSDDKK